MFCFGERLCFVLERGLCFMLLSEIRCLGMIGAQSFSSRHLGLEDFIISIFAPRWNMIPSSYKNFYFPQCEGIFHSQVNCWIT